VESGNVTPSTDQPIPKYFYHIIIPNILYLISVAISNARLVILEGTEESKAGNNKVKYSNQPRAAHRGILSFTATHSLLRADKSGQNDTV
jgi:hypothetical protein